MKRLLTVIDKRGANLSPYSSGNLSGGIASSLETELLKKT
jgi:hypothetical protein